MKILLVDDEEQVLKGVSRLISCEEDEWDVDTASSGQAALDVLSDKQYDVVISDMQMPGMDGAQLLSEIGQLYPGTLRIILSGQVDRETVLRAVKPMHQFLSKPCDPDQLFDAINRGRIFQETILSSEILDAIGRANSLPSFPAIVNEINSEIESENSSSKSIANIVSRDPILSARLLHVANSAIFALPNPVTDLDRAISLVGPEMLRSIAMSQAVYSGNECNEQILSAQGLLDHGFRVAGVGRKLAKNIGASSDECNIVFTAGLLHDVGKLILLNTFPDQYKTILETSISQDQCLEKLEMDAFDASHQGIGGYLFGLWGLPAEVIESVASHHSFEACAHGDRLSRRLVFAANWIVNDNSDEDIQRMLRESEGSPETARFAQQLTDWKESIATLESEE
jgi:putative nucleotidyltransferase with HDIG domain